MRFSALGIVLGMAMGLLTITGAFAATASVSTEIATKPSPPPTPPYTNRRWIGLREKGLSACPTVSGWKADRLLDLAALRAAEEDIGKGTHSIPDPAETEGLRSRNYEGAADSKLLRKYGLDRICVYTAGDSVPDFPSQPLPAGLVKAVRDRMALTAAGSSDPALGTIGDQIWPALADHFLAQVGKVQLSRTNKPSVRLVFVDTHRTGEGAPGNNPSPGSWHGFTMAHLAQQLVCSNDDAPKGCAIDVATRLALRYDHYDKDMPFSPDPALADGGHLGLISDLAIAILAEIEHWQQNDPETKLILNLSVGWDGELHEVKQPYDLEARKVSELDSSAQLVYDVLRYAAHCGVLVIAAAGNRRGGSESQWPLLPAAWELRRPSWLPFPIGYKPVYAVGGVDWQGLPLPNYRHGGLPWRTAYGDHAVVRTQSPGAGGTEAGNPTMVYTGTSVSAAVTSSIAAVVWGLRPGLRPAQVMKLIDHSGEVLDSKAEFFAWNWQPLSSLIGAPRLKRVSLCRTVLRLCGSDERRCPALATIDCELCKHPAADLSSLHPLTVDPFPVQERGSSPLCAKDAKVYTPLAGTPSDGDLCPFETYSDLSIPGLVNTQPGDNPCPSCTVVPDPPHLAGVAPLNSPLEPQPYDLALEIDPQWQEKANQANEKIGSAVVVIDCPAGSPREVRINIGQPPDAGQPVRLHLGPINKRISLAGCTASVDFRIVPSTSSPLPIGQDRSVQSPVYVDP